LCNEKIIFDFADFSSVEKLEVDKVIIAVTTTDCRGNRLSTKGENFLLSATHRSTIRHPSSKTINFHSICVISLQNVKNLFPYVQTKQILDGLQPFVFIDVRFSIGSE
jgi:hypothetical protein